MVLDIVLLLDTAHLRANCTEEQQVLRRLPVGQSGAVAQGRNESDSGTKGRCSAPLA